MEIIFWIIIIIAFITLIFSLGAMWENKRITKEINELLDGLSGENEN